MSTESQKIFVHQNPNKIHICNHGSNWIPNTDGRLRKNLFDIRFEFTNLCSDMDFVTIFPALGPDPVSDWIQPSKTVNKYTHGPKQDTKSKYGFYTIQNS
jgi:hypothetical protein